jgi:hypothetical protein
MDDTLWLANSVEELQAITQAAASFYTMVHIKVNPHKSFLTSNTKSTIHINFMNQTIQAQPQNTPFKFLGCWFTAALQYTTQTKLIQQEALRLNNILKTKNITDKQAAYIINTVIIPTLEYRIYNIVLPYTTCNYILSQYLTTAKHKAKLPVSIPNSTLLNHNIYGIKNI